MAFQRPTLPELVTRITNDFVSRMGLVTPILQRAFVRIMAVVYASVAHMLHGNLAFLADQLFPDTSEAEFLRRQAALYGLAPIAATFAEGNADVTGDDGNTVPAGTIVQRADGTQFAVDADATIASGTASLALTCLTAGTIGNTDAASVLTFVSPVPNVSGTATVDVDGIMGGVDAETDEALRERLLERLQAPPLGGSEADYERWAKEVAGVTRVWVAPQELGPGTVTVRFVRDADASIIPDAGEVSDVQDYIDARRPVTADVHVLAPVAVPLNFTISVTPASVAVKAAVEAELTDLISRDSEPGGTILLSRIREAVSIAAGESDNTVTVPAANVTNTTGQMSTMGTITWV